MTLRRLWVTLIALALLVAIVSWRDQARQARSAAGALVDTPLLDPHDLARARKIVVREKPQSKVVHKEEGFEVRRVVEDDAPIRETVLTRQGETWRVSSYFDLDADTEWIGRTMSDLSQGRLTRFLTSDPALMDDLGFVGTLVRLEDEHGQLVRQIEMGRKDGGETYQIVRIGGAAFVAKHETEILGDPLAWIVTRVFRFEAKDVRELELPFQDPAEPPLALRRAEPGAPLLPTLERPPNVALVSGRAQQILERLLAEPLTMAVARDHPAAEAARRNVAARVRLTLFDGRRYEVGYGLAPSGAPPLSPDVRNEDVIVMGTQSSDPQDVSQRYGAKVALVYSRGATLQRLPKSRAALVAPEPPPRRDEAAGGAR